MTLNSTAFIDFGNPLFVDETRKVFFSKFLEPQSGCFFKCGRKAKPAAHQLGSHYENTVSKINPNSKKIHVKRFPQGDRKNVFLVPAVHSLQWCRLIEDPKGFHFIPGSTKGFIPFHKLWFVGEPENEPKTRPGHAFFSLVGLCLNSQPVEDMQREFPKFFEGGL